MRKVKDEERPITKSKLYDILFNGTEDYARDNGIFWKCDSDDHLKSNTDLKKAKALWGTYYWNSVCNLQAKSWWSQVYYELLFRANEKLADCESIDDIEKSHKNVMEIIKDVPRTLSNYDVFSYHALIRKVYRVLLAFLEYNNGVEYVQGMNAIVGSLWVHVDESTAFWLFIELLENYNLDDVYSTNLTGMHLYLAQIKLLVQRKFKKVHDHMMELGIKYEMFAVNWVISLFWSYMPLHMTVIFWKKFFSEGWDAFYKVVFKVFKEVASDILKWTEMWEVLDIFKNLKMNTSHVVFDKPDSKVYKNWKVTQKWRRILS